MRRLLEAGDEETFFFFFEKKRNYTEEEDASYGNCESVLNFDTTTLLTANINDFK